MSNLGDDWSVGSRSLLFLEIILYDDCQAAYPETPEHVVQFKSLAAPFTGLAGIVTLDKEEEATV